MRGKYGSNIGYEVVGILSDHIKEIIRMAGEVLDMKRALHDKIRIGDILTEPMKTLEDRV